MTLEELYRLREPDVQALIALHSGDDPAQFAMQFHGRKDLPVRAIAEQIGCRRKAAKKLPSLSTYNLLYTPLSLEQASGERAAAFKASMLSGKRLIDLSGGLGIDSIFLSRNIEEVLYCERDPLLCAMMEHNLKQCGIGNVQVHHADSLTMLAGFPDNSFEWIYVDPARREEGRRSVTLESASPDVVLNHDLLLRKGAKVCIKASPALELSTLKAILPALSEIVVVSVDRECKESLLLLDRGARDRPVTIRAVALSTGSDAVVEVCGDPDADRAIASSLKVFLYEPDPAIIKARLSAVLVRNYALEFLNGSVDYLTGEQLIADFPGRLFRVLDAVPWKPKTFRAFLDRHHITGASIQRRDFPLSVEELRKRFSIRESERAFLFFTRNAEREPVVIYALKFFAEAG
ncbi:class I SAM-dependent methyltransferase [Chlorobium sp. KB01]|uniref:class I SAM-dependent methyltransferase n=1 Tax=Chlorobium sp. KB01 TaxID=1917528 RepID=UPI0009762101|nr:class I SAM-dependent methyltransferase [Chlorobium sp. KB01]